MAPHAAVTGNASEPRATQIRFVPSDPVNRARGLLGFVSLLLDDAVRIDGIAVRRTMAGKLALSFPMRRSRTGHEHYVARPVTDAAREAIEAQVFAALDLGDATP